MHKIYIGIISAITHPALQRHQPLKNSYWCNGNGDIVVSAPGKERLLSTNKYTMDTLHIYYLTDMLITWLASPIISRESSTLHDLYF